jgi:hypothetical protein
MKTKQRVSGNKRGLEARHNRQKWNDQHQSYVTRVRAKQDAVMAASMAANHARQSAAIGAKSVAAAKRVAATHDTKVATTAAAALTASLVAKHASGSADQAVQQFSLIPGINNIYASYCAVLAATAAATAMAKAHTQLDEQLAGLASASATQVAMKATAEAASCASAAGSRASAAVKAAAAASNASAIALSSVAAASAASNAAAIAPSEVAAAAASNAAAAASVFINLAEAAVSLIAVPLLDYFERSKLDPKRFGISPPLPFAPPQDKPMLGFVLVLDQPFEEVRDWYQLLCKILEITSNAVQEPERRFCVTSVCSGSIKISCNILPAPDSGVQPHVHSHSTAIEIHHKLEQQIENRESNLSTP